MQITPLLPNCRRCSASGGYMLLLECSRLLLALFSSALYSPNARGAPGQHPYLDAAMQQSDLANSSEQRLHIVCRASQSFRSIAAAQLRLGGSAGKAACRASTPAWMPRPSPMLHSPDLLAAWLLISCSGRGAAAAVHHSTTAAAEPEDFQLHAHGHALSAANRAHSSRCACCLGVQLGSAAGGLKDAQGETAARAIGAWNCRLLRRATAGRQVVLHSLRALSQPSPSTLFLVKPCLRRLSTCTDPCKAAAPLCPPPQPLSCGCPTRLTRCCCAPLGLPPLATQLPPQRPPAVRWAMARCCCSLCCCSMRRRRWDTLSPASCQLACPGAAFESRFRHSTCCGVPSLQDASFGNPYRQSLARLQDADDLGRCSWRTWWPVAQGFLDCWPAHEAMHAHLRSCNVHAAFTAPLQ